jgi:hypothetical protein
MNGARCIAEYCCNTATVDVKVIDRSGRNRCPIPWGWCSQHANDPKWRY